MTAGVMRIALPAAFVGTVNVWLLRGDPLTLIDAGERGPRALEAIEAALAGEGLKLEDVELLALTHNHVDHVGLVGQLRERSGAEVAALAPVADYGAHYMERTERERVFTAALLRDHGVPDALLSRSEALFDHMQASAGAFEVTRELAPGDAIAMGGREFTVVHRPGHSANDTLYVDARSGVTIGGDHLLAHISSIAEMSPDGASSRRRALVEYLEGLQETRTLPADVVLSGHGEPVRRPDALIAERLAFHRGRCEAIAAALAGGARSCFEIARRLWSERTVRTQPLHVVWEVLGHLDLLARDGRVDARREEDAVIRYALTSGTATTPAAGSSPARTDGRRRARARRAAPRACPPGR